MKQGEKVSVRERVKKFFVQLFVNLDKKMETEAKAKSCGCKPAEGKDKSCCS